MQTVTRIPNAKKWTEERVTEELAAIKHHALREDVDYLGIAIVRQGLYIQLWAYWKKIFDHHDDILEQMLIIESIFEARLVQAALRKKVSPWVAIFALKNNHHWTDKQVSDMIKPESEPMVIRLDEDTIILGPDEPGKCNTYRRESGISA